MRITSDNVYQALDGHWRTETEIRTRVFRLLGKSISHTSDFFATQRRDAQRVTINSCLGELVRKGYAACRSHEQVVQGKWIQRMQYRDPNKVQKSYE